MATSIIKENNRRLSGTVEASKSTTLSVSIPCTVFVSRGSHTKEIFLVNWDGVATVLGTSPLSVTKSGNNITLANNGGSTAQYLVLMA